MPLLGHLLTCEHEEEVRWMLRLFEFISVHHHMFLILPHVTVGFRPSSAC
jgi:hypothetical protein